MIVRLSERERERERENLRDQTHIKMPGFRDLNAFRTPSARQEPKTSADLLGFVHNMARDRQEHNCIDGPVRSNLPAAGVTTTAAG